MKKVWRVTVTEYFNSIRSKGFIIGVLAMPLLLASAFWVSALAQKKADVTPRRFVVVDETGALLPTILSEATERNQGIHSEKPGPGKPSRPQPDFLPEAMDVPATGSSEDLVLELSDRVRKKELFAFVIIKQQALDTNAPSGAVLYYTQTPTYTELPNWLRRVINEEVQRQRFQAANLDPRLVEILSRSVPFKELGLASRDEKGGITKAKEQNPIRTFAIPAAMMFLMFIMVMWVAPTLLNSVLEEKMQRISELLISAVSPFELMMGKLFGAVLVALSLAMLYIGAAVFTLWRFQVLQLMPVELYAWFFLFLVPALLMFGSIFLAIGAACTDIRDAQSLMFPAILLILIPMFTWVPIIESPTSGFARAFSLFPPATPMLMMLRIAIPPGPAPWELVVGISGMLAFTLLCIWAGAKIFRIGLLVQGQTPSLARLVSWLWTK